MDLLHNLQLLAGQEKQDVVLRIVSFDYSFSCVSHDKIAWL